MARGDSWKVERKAEGKLQIGDNTRFESYLVWGGHGQVLPGGLCKGGGGQLTTWQTKVLSSDITRYSQMMCYSPWAVERAENAAKASPKLGGVAGVFEGVPQGMPLPPPDL